MVEIELSGDGARDPRDAIVTPTPRSDERHEGVRLLRFRAGTTVHITHPNACSIDREATVTDRWTLDPVFTLPPDDPRLGYGNPFSIAVRSSCAELSQGQFTWRQLLGRRVEIGLLDGGRAATGVVAARPVALSTALPPVSYDEAAHFAFVATWSAPGRAPVSEVWHGGATPRYNGLPSLPVARPVQLGGIGWTVPKPSSAIALVTDVDGTRVEASAPGHVLLRDVHGADLPLRAGRYDDTPLDCGRRDCHPSIAGEAAGTKMTTVFARGLEGAFGDAYDPRCALACHAVGEPGTEDGGFGDVLRRIGAKLPSHGTPGGWAALPRALRRLGGVGCTACHGPGAIPDEHGRWAVLRVGVCATCHDAAPRYGHVAAWKRSAMARADAAPATRRDPACARCHTTHGFLASLGQATAAAWAPPPEEPPLGIACAACHTAHAAHEGPLLRQPEVPTELASIAASIPASARVCVACHSAAEAPGATQARLLYASPNPHATPGGCIDCHAGDPSPTEHGRNHSFAVDWSRCQRCHGDEARALLQKTRAELAPKVTSLRRKQAGPHAWSGSPLDALLGDPSAAAHNASYARTLLASHTNGR